MTLEPIGSDPPHVPDHSFCLRRIEVHREVPIYHLSYGLPTVFDRRAHEEELRMLAAIPEPRFGLIINYQNLSTAADYSVSEQVGVHQSALMQALRERTVATARYRPGSLSSMVRAMIVHIHARQGVSASFVPDLEGALRTVRLEIDRHLEREAAAPRPSTARG